MDVIERYELKESGDGYTLVVYMDQGLSEFSQEFGEASTTRESLSKQLNRFAREKFPRLKIVNIKVMVGSILVTSLLLGNTVNASAQYLTNSNQPLAEYTVQSGDTLYSIAKKNNVTVDEIKEINQLSSNTISIGQSIALPYTTYKVKAGDTLYRIALNHNTSVDVILQFNGMKSNTLSIGQQLKIPVSASDVKVVDEATVVKEPEAPTQVEIKPSEPTDTASTTYQVKPGDTLYSIARTNNTSVDTLKTLNNLTSNTLSIGQTLIVSQPEQVSQQTPTPEPIPETTDPPARETEESVTTSYTVVAGDSLFIIANKFGTTISAIKAENNLVTDTINIGQILKIPASNTQITEPEIPDSEAPQPAPDQLVVSPTSSYTVVAGDSLFIIANKLGTTIDAIKAENNLTTDAIFVGQTLKIPTSDKVEETTTAEEVVQEPVINVPDMPNLELSGPVTSNNQESYKVSGKSTPNTEVDITVQDEKGISLIKKITTDENGLFKVNFDLTSFSDGNLQLSATAGNEAGKSEIQKASILKETLIETPVVEANETANQETALTYIIKGTGKAGASVSFNVRDTTGLEKSFETTVKEDGTFSTNINLESFADSQLTVRAYQQDQLGNKSTHMLLYVEKDSTAPDAPIIDSNENVNNQNQSSYQIQGTAEAGASLTVTLQDSEGNSTTFNGQVGSDGHYSIPVNFSELKDGQVSVQVQQQDSVGNTSSLTSTNLSKNTEVPKASLKELPTVYSENEDAYMIEGIADNDTELAITLTDGETTIEATTTSDQRGNFSLPINLGSLKDGNVTLTITPTNQYGNVGETHSIDIQKDTTAPTELNLDMDEYINNTNQEDFVIRGTTDEDALTVTLRITDGENTIEEEVNTTNGEFQFNANLTAFKEGIITLEIMQTDQAGNQTGPQTLQVEKDITISTPTITRSGYATMSDGSTVFNIVGTADPASTVTIKVTDQDGNLVRTVTHTVGKNGILNVDIDMSGLDRSKSYTFSISQADKVGNISDVVTPTANVYTVQSGDTLSSIAKKYNTTVEAIRNLNSITGDLILVGQPLRLPVTASTTLSLGYMYFGDVKSFTNQVLSTERSFNTVSPSYFDLNRDGTLALTHLVDRTFVENMHQLGIRVVPFLSNHWDRDVGRALLENREIAAQQIADAVLRYNLDGVNIDIENITDTDRENFTDFVRMVRELLPASKEVSVAVAANPNGWTLGWHGAYDYNALAKHSDYLMMMTYDESYEGSDPGSVASYDWVDRSIQYAIKQGVPRDKIVMGLAQYGRFWKEGESTGGKGISNYQVQEMLDKYEHTVTFDETTKSAKAVVTIKDGDPKMYLLGKALQPGTYTVWFENDQAYQAKIGLVDKYDIHGVGNWSIGQEDKSIWSAYSTWFTDKDDTYYDIPVEVTEPVNAAPEETGKTYTVVSGDSLWRIATNNNITVNQLKEANGITNDMIYVGQVLKIPQS
ncbi:LysM peptidoglycan-binding domain-containing protein [Paucisalibacillus globulus]|uniref:LysM peptidoglycan-binding domain-containing protein n=1 Tax=Paucisalibacillus globulus TaxID=351095 RepID=UPI000BB95FB6|nr:LysM peptidoglycan-binding domain-containing protein [Paucisalibacillus globulus]